MSISFIDEAYNQNRFTLLKSFLTILLLISLNTVSAQTFISRWQYSWGGNRQDFFRTMIPLSGNRYFFGGTTASDITCTNSSQIYGDEDYVIVVFDDGGNKILEKTYGGSHWDQLHNAIKLPDGYILAGESGSGVSGIKTSPNYGISDFWIIRIDDDGNLLWEKSYGTSGYESAEKIIQTPDGGFLVAGVSIASPTGFGSSDYMLIKIDASGNLLWTKTYGGTGRDDLRDFIVTSDGNYFLSGLSDSPVSGNKTAAPLGSEDFWLIKIDGSGTILWDKSYGTSAGDYNAGMLSLADGNILLVETSWYLGRIRKIDPAGNQIWVTDCGGNDQDHFQVATEDPLTGNIYVAGMSQTNSFGCKTSPYVGGGWFTDIWITIYDAAGNKIDDLDYGGNDADLATDVHFLNGELWVVGWSDSPAGGNKTSQNCGQTADGWIIRLSKKFFINNRTPVSACNSQSNQKVHFTTAVDYNPGNIFTVQLSDIYGNFSSPYTIGSKAAVRSDSIVVNLPANLPESPNYKLRVIASSNSDTTATYPFWIHGSPEINLGTDTIICPNTSISLNVGTQSPNSTYQWSNSSNLNNLMVTAPGLYWCQVQNACGSQRDSILIEPRQLPSFSIGSDTSFCAGSVINIQSSVPSATNAYIWNTGATSTGISISEAGVYWLRDSNICGHHTDTLIATKHALPILNLDKDSIICRGNQHQLNAGGGFTSYQWSTGETSPAIYVAAPGIYWVKVQDQNNCINGDTATIKELRELPENFLPVADSLCSYQAIQIASLFNYNSYLWSTGSTNKFITIDTPGIYSLKVQDAYACSGLDTILITQKKCIQGFYIPNAFTPNYDGKNDKFKPIIGATVEKYLFTIYNRWGEIIFKTSDPNIGWDGTYKNSDPGSAVFVWTCNYRLQGGSDQSKKGSVVLIK